MNKKLIIGIVIAAAAIAAYFVWKQMQTAAATQPVVTDPNALPPGFTGALGANMGNDLPEVNPNPVIRVVQPSLVPTAGRNQLVVSAVVGAPVRIATQQLPAATAMAAPKLLNPLLRFSPPQLN